MGRPGSPRACERPCARGGGPARLRGRRCAPWGGGFNVRPPLDAQRPRAPHRELGAAVIPPGMLLDARPRAHRALGAAVVPPGILLDGSQTLEVDAHAPRLQALLRTGR